MFLAENTMQSGFYGPKTPFSGVLVTKTYLLIITCTVYIYRDLYCKSLY